MFIRIFLVEAKAIQFAEMVKGILSIRYDWDSMRGEMVKEFVVRY